MDNQVLLWLAIIIITAVVICGIIYFRKDDDDDDYTSRNVEARLRKEYEDKIVVARKEYLELARQESAAWKEESEKYAEDRIAAARKEYLELAQVQLSAWKNKAEQETGSDKLKISEEYENKITNLTRTAESLRAELNAEYESRIANLIKDADARIASARIEYSESSKQELVACRAAAEKYVEDKLAAAERYANERIAAASEEHRKIAERDRDLWKEEREKEIRLDAIKRSDSVITGKVAEQLFPFTDKFEYDVRDARFMGAPIDFVIFDGMSDGDVKQVVFLEVKTGKSRFNTSELQVKNVVNAGKVKFERMNL